MHFTASIVVALPLMTALADVAEAAAPYATGGQSKTGVTTASHPKRARVASNLRRRTQDTAETEPAFGAAVVSYEDVPAEEVSVEKEIADADEAILEADLEILEIEEEELAKEDTAAAATNTIDPSFVPDIHEEPLILAPPVMQDVSTTQPADEEVTAAVEEVSEPQITLRPKPLIVEKEEQEESLELAEPILRPDSLIAEEPPLVIIEPAVEEAFVTIDEHEPKPTYDPADVKSKLNSEFVKWNSPPNYDFVYRRSCFCMPDSVQEMKVKVRNGLKESVTYLDPTYNGGAPVPQSIVDACPTIDEQFATINKAIADEAYAINVEYNTDGYPQSIAVDWSPWMADEETYMSNKDVQIITDTNLTEPESVATKEQTRGKGKTADKGPKEGKGPKDKTRPTRGGRGKRQLRA